MQREANSDFGRDTGLLHKAVVTGRKVGADRLFWARLADSKALFREVVRLVSGGFVLSRPSFRMRVDYDRDLEDSMSQARVHGMEHRTNREVFPKTESGAAGVEIVLFAVVKEPQEEHEPDYLRMEERIRAEGCRGASIEETLALLEYRPDLGENFPNIVAAGSHFSAHGSAVPLFSVESGFSWEQHHFVLREVCSYFDNLFFAAVREI